MLTTMAAAAIQRENWQCDDGSQQLSAQQLSAVAGGRDVPFCNSDTIFATATQCSSHIYSPSMKSTQSRGVFLCYF